MNSKWVRSLVLEFQHNEKQETASASYASDPSVPAPEQCQVILDCNYIIDEVGNDLANMIEDSGAKIYSGMLPVISGSEMEIKQLFHDLVSSAVQCRRKGKAPKVWIESEEQDGHQVFRVAFNDSGLPGNASEDMRNDTVNKHHGNEKWEGTEMVADSCRNIVELHGGRIWISSDTESDCVIYFTLEKGPNPKTYVNGQDVQSGNRYSRCALPGTGPFASIMPFVLTILLAAGMMTSLNAQDVDLENYHIRITNESAVNSEYSDFGMVEFAKGTYLFTSDGQPANTGNKMEKTCAYSMYTYIPGVAGHEVQLMPGVQGLERNNGPATQMNGDAFYFTGTNPRSKFDWQQAFSYNTLVMKEAVMTDGEWKVRQISNLSSRRYNYGHPTVSADGSTMVLVSDRNGGEGDLDIYVSYRTEKGWSNPENIGSAINTTGREAYPFLHASGTLFFASDGHGGLGGLDLFMCRKTKNGWSAPEHLGSRFNSVADDFSIFFKEDLSVGFLSSNRDGGKGSDDIYRIHITPDPGLIPVAAD